MPRRRSQGGRPSKGERDLLSTRLPVALAEAVRDEAERQGLSYSDYIGNLIAAKHGHPPLTQAADKNQMKLTA